MRHLPRNSRFSPALVLAAVALIVALAGTATAAGVAKVTSLQIKNGTIRLVDLNKRTKQKLRGRGAGSALSIQSTSTGVAAFTSALFGWRATSS